MLLNKIKYTFCFPKDSKLSRDDKIPSISRIIDFRKSDVSASPLPTRISHLRAVALRCFYTSGIISRNDRARVHFPQRVPQHIATPLLLYGSVHSLCRKLYTPPRGIVEGVRARARFHILTLVLGVRSLWHPQNGRFALELDPGIPDGPFDSERRLSCASGSFRYSNYYSDDI